MLIPIPRAAFWPLIGWSFLAGWLSGAVYDLFRIRRAIFRLPTGRRDRSDSVSRASRMVDAVWCFAEDVLFALLVTVVLILLDFKLYYGVPRWYSPASALAGFAFWHVTLGRLILGAAEAVLRGIAAAMRFLGKRVVSPVLGAVLRLGRRAAGREKRRRALRLTRRSERAVLEGIARLSLPGKETKRGSVS